MPTSAPPLSPADGKDLPKDYDAFNPLCLFKNNKDLREFATSEKQLLALVETCSKDLFLAYEYNSSKEHGFNNFDKLRIMFGVISSSPASSPTSRPRSRTSTRSQRQPHIN